MDHDPSDLEGLRDHLVGSRRTAWVRAAFGPIGDDAQRVLALQAVVGPRPEGWQERTWAYDQCTFAAGRVTARRLAQWFKGGKRKLALSAVRTTIEFPEAAGFTRLHAPSLANYRGFWLPWPAFMYNPAFAPGGHVNAPQGYFVGEDDTPSFPSFAGAFNAFFFDDFTQTGVGNPELGVATIHVVDGRARIRRVRIRPASLDVWLGGSGLGEARLELNGQEHRAVVPADKSRISLPLPNGLPSDAWLWLKSGSAWLDFRALSGWGGSVSPDIERDIPRDPGAELSRLLTQGEGLSLEYKEKLPDTKTEKRSVFKTVVAFANGAGGTIVFGVEDETNEVKGISGPLQVERRRLNDLARDLVSPSPRVRIESAKHEGSDLLVLHVQPGGGTIHALVLDANKPEYYVRRDGSTYHARPEDLAAIAGQRAPVLAASDAWIQ